MMVLTIIGLLGAVLAIAAYGLLAQGLIGPRRGYAWLTLIAASMIGASLFQDFNAPAALIQAFFGGIALYSLTRPE